MSSKEDNELIFENNSEIKIDLVKFSNKDKKKKNKHLGFFVDDVDYLNDTDKNKIICVKCTDTFFNIFFSDQKDENDPIMKEIFKSKYYMDYIPNEEVYRCGKCGSVELPKDPQISKQREKKIMGAGIENFPEYVSYLNPNTVKADYIGTANINKKRSKPKPVFSEESEEEKFARYLNSVRN